MIKLWFPIICFSFSIVELCVAGDYTSVDLFSIPWGGGDDELLMEQRIVNDPGTPEDSTDDYIEPSMGPSLAVVDGDENVIISSYAFTQLKGFSSSGDLIFTIPNGEPDVEFLMAGRTYNQLFIDSLRRIHIAAFPPLYFVPVIDYTGNVIDCLFPFGSSSSNEIIEICLSPSGTMIFGDRTKGFVTYSGGEYFSGGSCGFLASDGKFYSAKAMSPTGLRLNRYEDPDSMGIASSREFTEIDFPGDSIYSAFILNGGGGDRLYAYVRTYDLNKYEIWEFDLTYNLISEIVFPPLDDAYDLIITPFVRRDGNIYEFRFRQDGFHVVRWSKE